MSWQPPPIAQSYVPPRYPVEEVAASTVVPGDQVIVNGVWTVVQDVSAYGTSGYLTFDTALGSVFHHLGDMVRIQRA